MRLYQYLVLAHTPITTRYWCRYWTRANYDECTPLLAEARTQGQSAYVLNLGDRSSHEYTPWDPAPVQALGQSDVGPNNSLLQFLVLRNPGLLSPANPAPATFEYSTTGSFAEAVRRADFMAGLGEGYGMVVVDLMTGSQVYENNIWMIRAKTVSPRNGVAPLEYGISWTFAEWVPPPQYGLTVLTKGGGYASIG